MTEDFEIGKAVKNLHDLTKMTEPKAEAGEAPPLFNRWECFIYGLLIGAATAGAVSMRLLTGMWP